MNILQKPYHLLAITGLIAALFSLLPLRWRADINFQDTYMVMEYSFFLRTWTALLLLLWGINFAGSSLLLSVRLNWVHTLSILLALVSAHFMLIDRGPVRYSSTPQWLIKWNYLIKILPFLMTIAALLAGVVALLINGALSWQLVAKDR